jgi:LPS export ABC transporter protein LptC
LAIAVIACGAPATGPGSADYRDLPADQIMTGVNHNSTSDGIRSATGTFDTVYVFNDSSAYYLKGVSQQLFDAEGRQSATIRSDSGVLNLATNAMIARGKVVLLTQKQCRIESEELHYDPQTRRVWSDVFTTFVAGDRTATAQSFNADDQFNNVSTRGLNGLLPDGC